MPPSRSTPCVAEVIAAIEAVLAEQGQGAPDKRAGATTDQAAGAEPATAIESDAA